MKPRWKKVLAVLAITPVAIAVTGYAYLQSAKFGAAPDTESQALSQQSPNYEDGIFHNLEPIPDTSNESDSDRGWLDLLLTGDDGRAPSSDLPVVKTDLKSIAEDQDTVVWLGHSSFYIQLEGKRFLIDPVFSQNASPVPFTIQAFDGTSIYSADDIPDIDYLLISHDHWDHLDYPTIMALKDRIDNVVTGLGVGTHFREWGFSAEQIHEKDWNTQVSVNDDFDIHVLPARHYSGRELERNQTLWVSFGLQSSERQLYFSGDSGYGSHFEEIGELLGDLDLAMLDAGQYDPQWRYTHMMPEDAAEAARDLDATLVIPAHVGRFSLAFHEWDDPFIRLSNLEQASSFGLLTPRIGEPLVLEDSADTNFSQWWNTLPDSD